MKDVILITGVPGAGKTTISVALAQQLPRSAHISGDRMRTMIKGGFKNPAEPWDQETRKQYYLSFKNESSLAKNLNEEGFIVIIDDVIHAGDLYQEWIKHFSEFRVQKVVLIPPKEFSIKRNLERESHHVNEEVISMLYDDFVQYDYSGWIVVDNSNLTIEETVKEIRSKLEI